MKIASEKELNEIVTYVEKSISNLAHNMKSDFSDSESLVNFLAKQYDMRLNNLLEAKGNSIHYLESKTKNNIIQRKKDFLKNLANKKFT